MTEETEKVQTLLTETEVSLIWSLKISFEAKAYLYINLHEVFIVKI